MGSERMWGYVFWDLKRKGCFDGFEHSGELDEWNIWDVGERKEKEGEGKGKGKQVEKGRRWWISGMSKKAMGSRVKD